MSNIKHLLEEEVQEKLGDLKTIDPTSDEYKTAVDSIAKLTDKINDIEKLETENEIKREAQDFESNFKIQQMENEENDRKVRNWLTGIGIAVPAGLTIWGTLKSLKFEETGTLTTIMGRGFINKLLPKK